MDARAEAPLRIAIVSAESLAEGFAPNRFVSRFRTMMEARGHQVSVVGRDDGPYHSATALTRITRYAHVAIGAIRAMATSDVIVTRGHFAHFPGARSPACAASLSSTSSTAGSTTRRRPTVSPACSAR